MAKIGSIFGCQQKYGGKKTGWWSRWYISWAAHLHLQQLVLIYVGKFEAISVSTLQKSSSFWFLPWLLPNTGAQTLEGFDMRFHILNWLSDTIAKHLSILMGPNIISCHLEKMWSDFSCVPPKSRRDHDPAA